MADQSDADAWLAEARTEEAAKARSRRRWLAQQAAESATLVGALADLADAERDVVVGTTSGNEHRGRVTEVGADVVIVSTGRRKVLVPLVAVAQVRTGAAGAAPTSDRGPTSTLTLLAALERLRDDGARVAIGVAGGRMLSGELVAVGVDVVTVRSGSGPDAVAYVPLDGLLEVEVAGSG